MRGSGEASFLSVIQSKVQKAQHDPNTHNDTQLRIVAHPPNTVTIDQLIMVNLPTVHLPVLWWNLIVLISLYKTQLRSRSSWSTQTKSRTFAGHTPSPTGEVDYEA